ncbi:hypothetical protein FOMPIDRAFT_1039072 [Fomitopsis schrenkii]|uniref:Cytochrome P450 n=1 Tax=Fomitopsis schrenkii TaxID=2126942 RepID=S8EUY9_FOMSC|nr:hypothetical protein FOMPIDRAFT_1039072 [Fomitopsis schrenkii]
MSRPWRHSDDPEDHHAAPTTLLSLHSARRAISELLDKRGAIYSDRPYIPMVGDLGGYGLYTALLPYGPRHREGRKIFFSHVNPRNALVLHEIQEDKVAQFVSRLAAEPASFLQHIHWLVSSITLRLTHGLTIQSLDDPIIGLVEDVIGDFSKMSAPGAYLVDSFPSLKYVPDWFPGAGFAKCARARLFRAEDKLYAMVKEQVNNSNATPEEEKMYKQLGIMFYTGRSFWTSSAIESFLILMAQHPDVQRKVQAEVDALTKRSRPTRPSDRKDLPYLNAVLWEVFRYNTAGPLALPHQVRRDDNYAGYWIPAGSTVLANTWAILHDPAIYPDPYVFDPERYLQKSDDGLNLDPRDFAFGYGRRVCPGQMLAEDVVFLTSANILTSFDVSDAFSLDGSVPKWSGGTVSRHEPFRCTVKPRTVGYRVTSPI